MENIFYSMELDKSLRDKNERQIEDGMTDGHMVSFISGKTNKILLVDSHKFYKSTSNKSTVHWNCRLLKSLG